MTSIYVTSFNAPEQFLKMVESLEEYDSDLISSTRKILINNSSNDFHEKYQEICDVWGFEHVKFDNLGIMGSRLFVAKHFDLSQSSHYLYFEDDMLLSREGKCENGYTRWCFQILKTSLEIMEKEGFDFIKLSFTEIQLSNKYDWVLSLGKNPISFGGNKKLVETEFFKEGSHLGLGYAEGVLCLNNWPVLMSKRGNWLCYLEKRFSKMSEHEIARSIHPSIKGGKIRSAVLLLSPVKHSRFQDYEGRREY